jgi:hypothetical protein
VSLGSPDAHRGAVGDQVFPAAEPEFTRNSHRGASGFRVKLEMRGSKKRVAVNALISQEV